MSNKTFTTITINDEKLRRQIRGTIPLREKQIHKDRREKRQGNRKWRECQGWED